MRVGFTGTGGTGKTTVAKLCATHACPHVPGVTRALLEKLDLSEARAAALNPLDQWHVQKTAFALKIEQDYQNDSGVFDRTLLDHLAYCLYRCGAYIADSAVKSMLILTKENLAKYDALFYFPLYHWVGESDGLRDEHFGSRFTVDLIIQGLTEELNLDVFTVPDIGPELRRDYVLRRTERLAGEAAAKAEGETRRRPERRDVVA